MYSHTQKYTVAGTIVQQSLAGMFNSHGQDFFFYAGRILQQWCSLLKICAMYQEYDTWSRIVLNHKQSSFNELLEKDG